jgi:hypothetical protein
MHVLRYAKEGPIDVFSGRTTMAGARWRAQELLDGRLVGSTK